ncbi:MULTISPECIES: hypothetical protein [Gordonia]|uniref:Uncharacterized protein n=1 Tax=Gordonia amicalis TaxID=89053 RepID=A0ABU4D8J0_9ACTN|nr:MULTISPECIES: hypothetical protein [Gordonia]ATD70738.1 hypothetical protein CNO18_11150 [Gordonia sp. 1D]MDV6306042.1 hypothetical protein [Gordonia amicalis]
MTGKDKLEITKDQLEPTLWYGLQSSLPSEGEGRTTLAELLKLLADRGVDIYRECQIALLEQHGDRLHGETVFTADELLKLMYRSGDHPQHVEVDGTTMAFRGISSVTFDYQRPREPEPGTGYQYDRFDTHQVRIGDSVTVKFVRDR